MIHFSLENEVQFSLLLTKNLLTSKNDHNFQFLLQSTQPYRALFFETGDRWECRKLRNVKQNPCLNFWITWPTFSFTFWSFYRTHKQNNIGGKCLEDNPGVGDWSPRESWTCISRTRFHFWFSEVYKWAYHRFKLLSLTNRCRIIFLHENIVILCESNTITRGGDTSL